MPSNFTSLPVVDVSGLYASDPAARRRVAAEIGAAARDSGFLYVVGHPIADAARERLLVATRTFFARPMDEKMRSYIGNSKSHSGYVPPGEEVFYDQKPDRKEAYDVSLDVPEDDPDVASGRTPMLGPVQWPDDPAFRTAVGAYYTDISALARTLFRGFALALDLPETYFEAYLTKPPSQLRLIHYPYAADAPADEPGIGAHTDYECFTILWPTAPGLEVMNGAGAWIDAPPIDGAFIINIGDMLEAWSNGTFVATSHRVRKVKEERYSFPYFAACNYHTVVEPLPQFLSDGQPARFEPLVAGDHLLAQTAQTFQYLKKRIAESTFTLPPGARKLSSFGQEAIHAGPSDDARGNRRRMDGREQAHGPGLVARDGAAPVDHLRDGAGRQCDPRLLGPGPRHDGRCAHPSRTPAPRTGPVARNARPRNSGPPRRRRGRRCGNLLVGAGHVLGRLDRIPALRQVSRARHPAPHRRLPDRVRAFGDLR